MGADYSSFLESLGVRPGSRLLIHSNLGLGLGVSEPGGVLGFLEQLEDLVGGEGTIALPAFSYSFAKGEVFHKGLPVQPEMGLLSLFAAKRGFYRTRDPMFSFLLMGGDVEVFEPSTQSSNGDEGSFGKFFGRGFEILSIGLDFGTTLLHEVEFQQRVTYRYTKTFKGLVRSGDGEEPLSWEVFVRDLDDDSSFPQFQNLTPLMLEQDYVRRAKVGRRSSFCWSLDQMKMTVETVMSSKPRLLVKGP